MIDRDCRRKIAFGLNLLWWEGWDHINWFNHSSLVAVVTPTDCPKSVRNCCVIKVFGCIFVLLSCHRTESDLLLFSWICFIIISNGSIRRTATCVAAQRLREESHLPFFLLSRLRKVSYLAVSVRLTVKHVNRTISAFPASRNKPLECITWADMSEF